MFEFIQTAPAGRVMMMTTMEIKLNRVRMSFIAVTPIWLWIFNYHFKCATIVYMIIMHSHASIISNEMNAVSWIDLEWNASELVF